MATIKSYTTIEQSRKLAEILPLESADMYFIGHQSIINPKEWEYKDMPKVRGKYIAFDDKRIFYPCWSLAALFGVLPNENILVKTTDGEYYCLAKDVMTKHYDNPVDAYYEMILKLHELKML